MPLQMSHVTLAQGVSVSSDQSKSAFEEQVGWELLSDEYRADRISDLM